MTSVYWRRRIAVYNHGPTIDVLQRSNLAAVTGHGVMTRGNEQAPATTSLSGTMYDKREISPMQV